MTEDSPSIFPESEPHLSASLPELEEPDSRVFVCPHCSSLVTVDPGSVPPFLVCHSCGGQFTIGSNHPADLEYESRETDRRAQDAELDGMRIRQVSALRRGAIRARTYLQIGGVVCATGGIQLGVKAVQRVRYESVWDARTFAFVAFGVVSVMLAFLFFKRANGMSRELKKSLLDEPTVPPDFATLSDGTQHARDLEDIR